MRAVVLHETGGPEVLRLEEVPDPVPGEGEVLVRVQAVGVNRFDLNQRAGGARELPLILGRDAAALREDTGDRVLLTGVPGTYAELVAAAEDKIWTIPDSLGAPQAAALGVPYRTAWWSIVDLGELAQGKTLLVQGGSSSTGQAAVDIGRALGARVVATGSPGKLDRLRELGAEALAYDDPGIEELGADVVFDPVGADTFERSVKALARDGRLVTPGAIGDSRVSFDVWSIVGKRARIIGIGSAPTERETLARLISMAADGRLRPVIDRELPLEHAAEAHRAIEARETFGKVILRP
jgi:NADPH:quinone reductase-like Zn-dependent oxidoreductase